MVATPVVHPLGGSNMTQAQDKQAQQLSAQPKFPIAFDYVAVFAAAMGARTKAIVFSAPTYKS